jgi:predicted DNA-binding transcriptional regulator AlpA
MRGEGPPFHRCGPKLVVYIRSELDTWLAGRVGAAPQWRQRR